MYDPFQMFKYFVFIFGGNNMMSCFCFSWLCLKFFFVSEQNDPCRERQCGFGAKCVVTPDGRNASCVCPDKCPNYGDHSTSRPVCGSDGVDYKNQCELERAACSSNTNITIKFSGKCGKNLTHLKYITENRC